MSNLSQFKNKQNLKLLWDVLLDEININLSNKTLVNNISTVFESNINLFTLTTNTNLNIMELNKHFLSQVVLAVNKLFPNLKKEQNIQKITIFHDIEKNIEPYKIEDIQSLRKSKFEKEVEQKQFELDTYMTSTKPKELDFSDKNLEVKIKEIDALIAEKQQQRNLEIEDLQNSNYNSSINTEKWLTSKETSFKNEKTIKFEKDIERKKMEFDTYITPTNDKNLDTYITPTNDKNLDTYITPTNDKNLDTYITPTNDKNLDTYITPTNTKELTKYITPTNTKKLDTYITPTNTKELTKYITPNKLDTYITPNKLDTYITPNKLDTYITPNKLDTYITPKKITTINIKELTTTNTKELILTDTEVYDTYMTTTDTEVFDTYMTTTDAEVFDTYMTTTDTEVFDTIDTEDFELDIKIQAIDARIVEKQQQQKFENEYLQNKNNNNNTRINLKKMLTSKETFVKNENPTFEQKPIIKNKNNNISLKINEPDQNTNKKVSWDNLQKENTANNLFSKLLQNQQSFNESSKTINLNNLSIQKQSLPEVKQEENNAIFSNTDILNNMNTKKIITQLNDMNLKIDNFYENDPLPELMLVLNDMNLKIDDTNTKLDNLYELVFKLTNLIQYNNTECNQI
jgi:hypothetical protein